MTLTVGSLFSGIGGFDLGLERAGMRVIWQSEIDPYACAVLRKHWPGVPNLGDIRTIRSPQRPDVICGGFPCQPFSTAAAGANKAADLWPEFLRIVRDVRPRFVLAENVPGIVHTSQHRVVADLRSADYTVWPLELDSAPPSRRHVRERLLVVAHANGDGKPRCSFDAEVAGVRQISGRGEEDDAGPLGMDDGLSTRVVRLRCLGNAITPWASEMIGRAVVRFDLGLLDA